jgi:preprotein translocase subunit YajC
MADMFITAAYAQTAQAQAPSMLNMLVLMAAFFAIMYFIVLRPQQKRMKEHRDMVAALKRGDVVVTAGGLIGKVTRVLNDAELQVELAEGVRVRVVRNTISEVRTRSDVREVDARKAIARKDEADNDDEDTSASGSSLQAANDADTPKKDA